MFSSDTKSPLTRVVVAVGGMTAFGWGFNAIYWRGDLHYTNWFGELVFAPFAILFGLLMIFSALFKPEMLGGPASRTKR